MIRSFWRFAVCSVVGGVCAGAALGQPAMVVTGMAQGDISSDGMSAAGPLYDAALQRYIVYKYTRGAGGLRTGDEIAEGDVRMSNDGSAMSWCAYNDEGLNNAANSIEFDLDYPATATTLAHRWTQANGAVNMGPAPNGNRCGQNINTPYDISGDGRFVVGGGWTNESCGPFHAFSWDSATATWTQLPGSISAPPLSQSSTGGRANAVSHDGTVICGYDYNYESMQLYETRLAAVWILNGNTWTLTVLDPDGGEAFAVNEAGTVVVGVISDAMAAANPGDDARDVQMWTRSGNTWTRTDLGHPADRGLQTKGGDGLLVRSYPTAISGDGSTIIGFAEYNDPDAPFWNTIARPMIWRATINGGVPIDFEDYLHQSDDANTTNPLLTVECCLAYDANGHSVNTVTNLTRGQCVAQGGVFKGCCIQHSLFTGQCSDLVYNLSETECLATSHKIACCLGYDENNNCNNLVYDVYPDDCTAQGGTYGCCVERDLETGECLSLDTNIVSGDCESMYHKPIAKPVVSISSASALSADGSAILVGIDDRRACLPTGENAILYLDGTTCEPARLNFDPVSDMADLNSPPYFGAIFNAFATGSWPLNYQWQKQTAPGVWSDLSDDNCGGFSSSEFSVRGATTAQLRIGFLDPGVWTGRYRCVVSNACGSVTSAPAQLTAPLLPGDMNCDGAVNNFDIDPFVLALIDPSGYADTYPGCNRMNGDVNLDQAFNNFDIDAFVELLLGGS